MSRTQNGSVWADGEIRDWPSLSVPLMSDAIVRSAAVFDGIRADLTPDGSIRLLGGYAHAKRLVGSARFMRLSLTYGVEDILRAAALVARAEMQSTGQRIAYVRPMVLGAALTEQAEQVSLTIAAFGRPDTLPVPLRLQISSLRRPAPDSLPPQVKAVANYQLSRLARIAAHAAGYDDALILNQQGRIAESAGAAVLAEIDGRLITPSAWDGCLSSITVDILEQLAAAVGIPFVREPLPFASIWSADGLALAGTLSEVVDVRAVDDHELPAGKAISALRSAFQDALNPANAGYPHAALMLFSQFADSEFAHRRME